MLSMSAQFNLRLFIFDGITKTSRHFNSVLQLLRWISRFNFNFQKYASLQRRLIWLFVTCYGGGLAVTRVVLGSIPAPSKLLKKLAFKSMSAHSEKD